MTWARSWPVFAQSFDTPPPSCAKCSIILTNHKKGCFAAYFLAYYLAHYFLRTKKKAVLLSTTGCRLALVEFDFCSIGRKW